MNILRKSLSFFILSGILTIMLFLPGCGDDQAETPLVGFINPPGLQPDDTDTKVPKRSRFFEMPVSDAKQYSFTGSFTEFCGANAQCSAVYFKGLVGLAQYEGFVAKDLHVSPSNFTLYAYHVVGNDTWTIKVIIDGKVGTAETTTPFSSGPTTIPPNPPTVTINGKTYEIATSSATFNAITLVDDPTATSPNTIHTINNGDTITGQFYPNNFPPK